MSQRPLTLCLVGNAASVHLHTRSQCFAKRGHRVVVISSQFDAIEGVEVIHIKRPDVPLIHDFLFLREYWRILKEINADIIHVHYASSPGAWMVGALDTHPLVVTLMGGDILFDERGTYTPSRHQMTINLLKTADLITVELAHFIDVIVQKGVSKDKAKIVLWGIDLNKFKPQNTHDLRHQLNLDLHERIIFSPRNRSEFYNIHLIIQSLPKIIERVPNIRLILGGKPLDEDYSRRLQELVDELELSKYVLFVEWISYDQMSAFFSLADVAVSLAPSDAFARSILEAMACGTPTVLGRLLRYEEILEHRENTYFVDFTPQTIADGILTLLENPQLANIIAQNALQIVQSIADMDKEVERVETMYYELQKTVLRRRKMRPTLMSIRLILMAGVEKIILRLKEKF
jgi:glycosyltransferase involved in cell wall biosynthesis